MTCAGSPAQKGVTTYALSNNRQKPLGGAFHNAIFNTFRRTRQQILFWAPPLIAGYSLMQWAIEKCVHPRILIFMAFPCHHGTIDGRAGLTISELQERVLQLQGGSRPFW